MINTGKVKKDFTTGKYIKRKFTSGEEIEGNRIYIDGKPFIRIDITTSYCDINGNRKISEKYIVEIEHKKSIDECKKELQGIKYTEKIINVLVEQLTILKAYPYKSHSNIIIQQHNHSSSHIDNVVERIINFEEKINYNISIIVDIKKNILSIIDLLPNKTLQAILLLRYVHLKKWFDVSQQLNYEKEHLHRLHKKALYAFTEMFNKQNGY